MAHIQSTLEAIRLSLACVRRHSRFCSLKQATVLSLLLLACVSALPPAHGEEPDTEKVREAMGKLAPLVGKWEVAVKFYELDGRLTPEEGTCSVSFILEGRYLEWQSERHILGNPAHSQKYIALITFDSATNRYRQTYFYARWAGQVAETGEFDDATQEFRTKALIPLEDGVNDEMVRSVTSLKDPKKIVYRHYSIRSPAESSMRMDEEEILTPAQK